MVPRTANHEAPTVSRETTIYGTPEWAPKIAADIDRARHSVTISAISAQKMIGNRAGPLATLWRALAGAAARGVAVNLILPTPQKAHPATWANLDAARYAHDHGINAQLIPGPRLWHAKTCVIDQLAGWIGSGNLTDAATIRNHEFWTRTDSPDFVADLREMIHDAAGLSHHHHGKRA